LIEPENASPLTLAIVNLFNLQTAIDAQDQFLDNPIGVDTDPFRTLGTSNGVGLRYALGVMAICPISGSLTSAWYRPRSQGAFP